MQVIKCPAYEDYDVFGVPNKGCCFRYHDYCKNIEHCSIKDMLYRYGNTGIDIALGVEDEEGSIDE